MPEPYKADNPEHVTFTHWVDRPIVAELIFFVCGAVVLCTLAIFQKSAMGEDMTALKGYILPFFFGGISAGLIGFFNRRSRRDLMARFKTLAERDSLMNANRAKSEVIANMSHELRTPLNAILGFSGAIQNETYGPIGHDKYREYIDDIFNSGKHLLELINDLLDVSAIEAGKLTLHEEHINISTIAQDALHVVQYLADKNQVELIFNADTSLPPLYADERRFRQIVLNLASNAIKFTLPGGTVTLDVHLSAQGQHVLSITDTGIGMDAQELSQALSPFGQVDSRLARKHDGTGLGLPLTKGLVELHGGEFEVVSNKGVGTTATATFPAERTAASQMFAI